MQRTPSPRGVTEKHGPLSSDRTSKASLFRVADPTMSDERLHVAVTGDADAGKTSLMRALCAAAGQPVPPSAQAALMAFDATATDELKRQAVPMRVCERRDPADLRPDHAVVVIVVDISDPEPAAISRAWQHAKTARAIAPRARIVVVGNRADERTGVSDDVTDAEFHAAMIQLHAHDSVVTSVPLGAGIDRLHRAIVDNVLAAHWSRQNDAAGVEATAVASGPRRAVRWLFCMC